MKIALAVKYIKDEYILSPAYGKAPIFMVYDLENNSFEIVENKYLNGKDVANFLSSKNVKSVITNHLGQGAYQHLKELNIKAYFSELKNKPVIESINLFKENKLKEFTEKDFLISL